MWSLRWIINNINPQTNISLLNILLSPPYKEFWETERANDSNKQQRYLSEYSKIIIWNKIITINRIKWLTKITEIKNEK
jgi:hypothetical protein